MSTKVVTAGIDYSDLNFVGRNGIIATAFISSRGGVSIVDPGPSSCLPVLRRAFEERGLTLRDLRSILLTHIHLDHAGATGTIVKEAPDVQVFVHERGARHLANPSKLLESATRLYGDRMDELWGDVLSVPEKNLNALQGGERVDAAERSFDVAYTPGHASHHVSYFDRSSGIAFVGDTAGIRRDGESYVMPPTPPPDIDVDAWQASIDTIERWRPQTIFITHFGPFDDVRGHLAETRHQLHENAALVREILERGGSEAEQIETFKQTLRHRMLSRMSASDEERYEIAGAFQFHWYGLARYWRKKQEDRR